MILVLSDLWVPFPGGAERLMFNLARDLMRRGEDVHVFTGYHPAKQFDGPPFTVLDVPETQEGYDTLEYFIGGYGPDVIITHHYWALAFEQLFDAIARAGIPVVQVVLNGRRLQGAAMAVFISNDVRNREGMNPQAQDMVIHPPAFDDVRADSHGDAIGFIKPLPHKGVDLFYDIARAMPDRKFICLRGEWQDIETIVELPNVEFMEPVDDIRDFYRRVRLVLVPSLSEDAGTVAQECAVNGIPCISSDVGGLRETNIGGRELDTRDPAEWVKTIDSFDDPYWIERVVPRMQGLVDGQPGNPMAQTELLDEFATRVAMLQQ